MNEPEQEQAGAQQAAGDGPPVLGYADPGMGRTQTIARFPDSLQAHLAAAKLETEGIRCVLTGQESILSGAMGLHGSLLAVDSEDARRAVEVLAATPARRYLTVPQSQVPPVAVLPLPACPKCACQEIGHPSRRRQVMIGTAVFLAWPVFMVIYDRDSDWASLSWVVALVLWAVWRFMWLKDRPWRCGKCGHQWYPGDVELEDDEDEPSGKQEP
jgi:hypothetical protein